MPSPPQLPSPPETRGPEPTGRSPARGAALFILGAGAAFATSGPLARYARPAHPLMAALGRVALAALLLAAVDLGGLLGELRAMPRRQRMGITLAGLLLAAHFTLFLWGLDTTSLPAAVSLVSLEPLSVVLCGWALHGIRPAPREQLGVLLATVGAVVVARGAGQGEHRLLGDALVLGAVAIYGFYLSAARAFRGTLPPLRYAALVYAVAALALAPFVLVLWARGVPMTAIEPHSALAILGLALIPTMIGHTAVQAASRRASPSLVALVSPVEALGGLAIGAALLGALPRPVEIVGASIILTGVTIAIFPGEGA